jgi:molybdopterin converting factor subunit 1
LTVEVRLFASLADRAGVKQATVEVDPASDVQALWDLLCARHPGLGRLGYRPMVACDRAYAAWTDPLDGVSEVAFLPPVSGG